MLSCHRRDCFILLVVLMACMNGAQADNLLINASFEGETLKGWEAFGKHKPALKLVEDACDGKQALQMTLASQKTPAGVQSHRIDLKQEASKPIRIVAHARQPKTSQGKRWFRFGLSLQVDYMDGQSVWEPLNDLNAGFDRSQTDWQKIDLIWLPDKPVRYIRLRLMYDQPDQTIYFDQTIVEQLDQLPVESPAVNNTMKQVQSYPSERFTFDISALPDALMAYIGDWQVQQGVLATTGDMPAPGWYLRAKSQYEFQTIRLRLRKTSDQGIIFIHTRHWRFLLRPNQLMAKLVNKPDWYNSAARNITFNDDRWHTLEISFDHDRMRFAWDDQALSDWTSPQDEWKGKPFANMLEGRSLEFVHDDEIFVLHAYQTGLQVDDIALTGNNNGPAQGFIETLRYPEGFVKDNAFQRLAPLSPVDVTWFAPKRDGKALPAVNQWRFTKLLPDGKPENTLAVDIDVLDESPKGLPGSLQHPNYQSPIESRIHFNLENAGIYTLKIPIEYCKNLANILEVEVDCKVVSREVYRGFNHRSIIAPERIKDYIPLKLKQGYHVITLRYSSTLLDQVDGQNSLPAEQWKNVRKTWKRGKIGFDTPIELVPGHQLPQWTFSANNPQPRAALENAHLTDLVGKQINLRLIDLPDGPVTIRLGFEEILLDSVDDRLMDISLNGKLVAASFDIVHEAGSDLVPITRDFSTDVTNGKIDLQLTGKNHQATLSSVEVLRDNKRIMFYNVGWTPRFTTWSYTAGQEADSDATTAVFCDAKMNANVSPDYAFKGHNLVANPGFDMKDTQGLPKHWRSAVELTKQSRSQAFVANVPGYKINELAGVGKYVHDSKVGHDAPGSLRVDQAKGELGITTAFCMIDYTKPQSFSVWAKSENANGTAKAVIYFYDMNYFDWELNHMPNRLIGKVESKLHISGTTDWTKLTVNAQPPQGTIYAAVIIKVDDQDRGSYWFDDAYLDGYGADALEITTSHLGYHPAGNKRILIKAMSDQPVQYHVARKGQTATVIQGQAKPLGFNHYPDRYYFQIDLAALHQEGQYTVSVKQAGISCQTDILISSNIYHTLTQKLVNALTIKKFNAEVPGYHEPSHLDDARMWEMVYPRFDHQVKVYPRTRQVLGGFYDAGDRIRHWTFNPNNFFGGMLVADHLADRDADLAKTGQELMLRGMDVQVDAMTEDGYFFYADKPYNFDSIPGYGIETFLRFRVAGPQTSGLFARQAIALSKIDPNRSLRYKHAAEKVYAATRDAWENQPSPDASLDFNQMMYSAKQMFGAMYLYQLTGEMQYKKDRDQHLQTFITAMQHQAYLEPGYRRTGEHASTVHGRSINLDILWMPTFVLKELPDHPLMPRLRQVMLDFANQIARLSSNEPWGQANDLAAEGQPAARWAARRGINYWTMLACGLARLGMELNEPDIVRLAERQMQWNLGYNPLDIAMVTGVGEHHIALGDMFSREPEFYLRHVQSGRKLWTYDGGVPTGAFKNPSYTKVIQASREKFGGPISGRPIGLPYTYLSATYPTHPGPSEYWQVYTGVFCAAAASLDDAMHWLAEHDKEKNKSK